MKSYKLICIDDLTDVLKFGDGRKELTFGKEYEILDLFYKNGKVKHYSIINDLDQRLEYRVERFVDRAKFRLLQLEKIIE
jgi:hypothetical protein